MSESTSVTIFGPNLSGAMQAKGYMHAHAAGCADCRKYHGEQGWTVEVTSRREIVEAIYADHMDETPNADWHDFDDLYVAPCLSLPDEPAGEAAGESIDEREEREADEAFEALVECFTVTSEGSAPASPDDAIEAVKLAQALIDLTGASFADVWNAAAESAAVRAQEAGR